MSSSKSDPKIVHRVIRFISSLAVSSFFTEVLVIGGENVPKEGPIIVAATHHNMILDPVILCGKTSAVGFPHRRILNYWSKASLFANPIMAYILYSSGNIPVDRKSKDRQILFKGTFHALSQGGAVALFPEGTSYTEPRIMQVKDGAAWAALEYTKWLQEHPESPYKKDAMIIPTSIVYTNKSKYRSSVVMEFGHPVKLDEYKEQFNSQLEGASRAAVKRLTRNIERELVETSINAPDWDTLYVARITRDILWEGDKSIPLEDYVAISQTIVDVFSTPDATSNFRSAKRNLLEYYSLLQSAHLTNSVLSALPIPASLDPNTPAAVPSRLLAVSILLRDTVSTLIRLPFFLFPLIVHLPVYAMGRFGARLVKDEEETQAQNKVAFGLISLLMVYSAIFFFLWAFFMYTPTGALLAAVTVYMFAVYHIQMIDDIYERAKRLFAAWRVLVGVWAPKNWDLSLTALAQYTTPRQPPVSAWITEVPKPSSTSHMTSNVELETPVIVDTQLRTGSVLQMQLEPPVSTSSTRSSRCPPSRRLVRHVLRARVKAVESLAVFFDQLGHSSMQKVKASPHLSKLYSGGVFRTHSISGTEDAVEGWRHAKEVIEYLKRKGAKIPALSRESGQGEWAALISESEWAMTVDEN